ncbi:uncharacterized protein LOC130010302 isoform X3 [Patella vulgata]|nr:uncharacterized protein LOC130010302 isoform X3 [Patella vulgata]XP_050417943.2 uncharacterized protein LOC130010302 isoform X3 [Patella vulgata]XP_050417945.2 uncharacterized protein LOC130010302 isoform X3 [Patella vulgata]XP_055959365.1 uncharacterized protein LOC130010302 isoform X3 [Patella vulgata]XP_055959366.1 uncharacterized protein LOC130010302 isoform X3 [Patella vulgata]XP_055959367.1 uncharacterized protein LOC130010302 isoform X3 [Patella vulgata]
MDPSVSTYVRGFHDIDAVSKMKYKPLGNTGLQISQLGYGGSGLAGVFKTTKDDESIAVLTQAIKKGINYIDTAPWYGNGKSETVLGQAFKNIPRDSFYVATKVGRYEPDVEKMFDFSRERTMRSIDESLQRMGIGYVDIIQVHDMEFAPDLDIILNETLPALQEIKDSGKARFIGITGYPLENFRTIIEKSKVKIDTVLSYCRGCMFDSSIQDYIPYFKEKGLGILNASPIGMGLLCESGPPKWHPANHQIKDNCQKAAKYCKDNNVDLAQLAVKHSLELPGVASTITSSESYDIVDKNLKLLSTNLTDKERNVYNDVMKRFMEPLHKMNWEGIEVNQYREKLAKLQDR